MTTRMKKILHPLYRRLETAGHPLRYLFIEITQRCNLMCRHCGSDCTRDTKLDELSTDEWLAFFAYLRRSFDTQKLVLVVTGGEPFCHPEFDRILDGLRNNGLVWGMVTNGYALTERNVAKAEAAGLWSATVSLDGLAKTHDWLRGKNGSFANAKAGIERLVAAKLPNFDVVTCVHPGNLHELPEIYSLLRELGVPAWRLFSIFPKGRAKESPELILAPEQLKAMLGFIRDQRKANSGGPRVQFSCEGYLPEALDAAVRDEPYFCRAGVSIASVLCDGSINACPNISRTLIQGNIRRDDFKHVWETGFAPYRDRSWMRQGACVDCADWSRCQGNSMHLWDAEHQITALCTLKAVTT